MCQVLDGTGRDGNAPETLQNGPYQDCQGSAGTAGEGSNPVGLPLKACNHGIFSLSGPFLMPF